MQGTLDWAGGKTGSEAKGAAHEQGSAAWLAWRNKGLGGSDSAALLGLSPWKDVIDLYEEKLGIRTPVFGAAQRSAMQRGKNLEPHIRKWYEGQTGFRFAEDIGEHSEFRFIRASYDGINREFQNPDGTKGRILEIKAPNMKDHALAKSGHVPDKYLTQLNWMGIVAGINWFDYVSYGSDDTYAIVTVVADPVMQKELMLRARKFWYCVENRVEPNLIDFPKWYSDLAAPVDMPESPEIASQEIEALVAEALKLQVELAAVEGKFAAVKENLKRIAGDREKVEFGEAVFGWQTRKGLVDYGAIEVLKSVDLDKYRKPETRAFYFKRKELKK